MRLKPLFFLASFLFSGVAFALPVQTEDDPWGEALAWSWTGRLRAQMNMALEQKPSSQRGQTNTEWGSLEFSNLLQSDDEPFEAAFAGTLGPSRDTNHREPILTWDEARFTWKHKPEVSMGLLIDPVVRMDAEEWGQSSFGGDFEAGASRWGLLPEKDLGLQAAWGTPVGLWIFQITNGEGWPKAETGSRKDSEIVWQQPFLLEGAVLRAQIFYRQGGYDTISDNDNMKRRTGAQLTSRSDIWSWGLTAIATEDSVDGINGVIGEGVDLSAKGGQIVRGQLQEAWLSYRWGESARRWAALLRSSLFRVDESDDKKDIRAGVFGVTRQLGAGMQLGLLFQSVDFADLHSTQTQDRQRWFLAWVWGLERQPLTPSSP